MDVPFYENPDDTHCFQAVFRMILKYYFPGKDYDWRDLERITDKDDEMWTSPSAGIIWLHRRGFEIRNVGMFDYKEFAERGGEYLVELSGKEVADEQIAHCNIVQDMKHAKQMVKANLAETRSPELSELKKLLDQKYLIVCNVNSKAINKKEGYAGHFVLLTGHTASGFILHDPGPPGVKNRHVAFSEFEKAWAYPDKKARSYLAARYTAN